MQKHKEKEKEREREEKVIESLQAFFFPNFGFGGRSFPRVEPLF